MTSCDRCATRLAFDRADLISILGVLRSISKADPASTIFADILVNRDGQSLPIKGRVPRDPDELIPVSSEFYDFVAVLDDNLADPLYAQNMVHQFVARLKKLRADQGIKSICFIEKDAGPVGALTMLAQLVAGTGMPATIYRESKWSKTANFAGRRPLPKERVAFVYDLVVTGGGIRHAAKVLQTETQAVPCAALVLFSYGQPMTPLVERGLEPIHVESLGWYQQEVSQIRKVAKEARTRSTSASHAGGAIEDASSKGALVSSPAMESALIYEHGERPSTSVSTKKKSGNKPGPFRSAASRKVLWLMMLGLALGLVFMLAGLGLRSSDHPGLSEALLWISRGGWITALAATVIIPLLESKANSV